MRKLIGGLFVGFALALAGCASAPPPAVGVWDIDLETPLGALPAVLLIEEDGTGNVDFGELGNQDISGILFEENSLSFSTSLDVQGQGIDLNFSGTVVGDSLTGEAASDFGGFPITGTRQQ